MKYGLMLVSRRATEPETYWEKTERGLALPCFMPNTNHRQKYSTDDINQAFRQFELLSVKLAERAVDFPPSDYYWVVEELQDINFLGGDISGSTAGPQIISEIWGSLGSNIPSNSTLPGTI